MSCNNTLSKSTLKNYFCKLSYLMLPLFYSKMLFWLYVVCDTAMPSQQMILVLRWLLAILKGREEEVLVNLPSLVVRTNSVITPQVAVEWVSCDAHRASRVDGSLASLSEVFRTMTGVDGPNYLGGSTTHVQPSGSSDLLFFHHYLLYLHYGCLHHHEVVDAF